MKQANASTTKTGNPDNAPRIEPLFNSAFARIFGREESKPLTRGLVNAVLEHVGLAPVDEIEAITAEHTATEGTVDCKTPRMDVRIIASGRVLDLEAQGYPEDMENRSLLYAAQLLCENTAAGTKYKDLPQVIVITLLDAPPLFPDAPEIAHICRMHWGAGWSPDAPDAEPVAGAAGAEGTDRMLFVVVELEKVRKRYNRLTREVLSDDQLAWAYLLTKGYSNDGEVEAIMSEVPSIEYFAELYGRAVDDPKVKQAFEDAVSAEREYQSRQDYFARLEREAAERGMEKGIDRMTASLRASGVDEAAIKAAVRAARETPEE